MSSRSPIQVIIPTGFGINCEVETAYAFKLAGAEPSLIHLNDLAMNDSLLQRAAILALAGGFSFGDHLNAGKVFANRLWRRLGLSLQHFVTKGGLVLGLCNGFQTLARLGLVPDVTLGTQRVTLAHNQHGKFYNGWVTLRVDPQSPCIFTRGLTSLDVPVRHGEGRLLTTPSLLQKIRDLHLSPVKYADQETLQPTDVFPANPNGSQDCMAGLCDPSGRIFGMMPHPEAFLHAENHPQWRRRKKKGPGDGVKIFRNAVEFAEKNF